MSRYIDAEELLKHKTDHEMISTHLIYNAPTADVVDVVRCKDCKWYDGNECFEQLGLVCARDDDFCSWGERRENGN